MLYETYLWAVIPEEGNQFCCVEAFSGFGNLRRSLARKTGLPSLGIDMLYHPDHDFTTPQGVHVAKHDGLGMGDPALSPELLRSLPAAAPGLPPRAPRALIDIAWALDATTALNFLTGKQGGSGFDKLSDGQRTGLDGLRDHI